MNEQEIRIIVESYIKAVSADDEGTSGMFRMVMERVLIKFMTALSSAYKIIPNQTLIEKYNELSVGRDALNPYDDGEDLALMEELFGRDFFVENAEIFKNISNPT